MNTTEAIDAFALHWQQYHGTTALHQIHQRRALEWLAESFDGELLEVRPEDFRRYLELRLVGRQASTVKRQRKLIRPFFTWAFQADLMDADRYIRLRQIQGPRGKPDFNPRPYNERDRVRLWRAFDDAYPWFRNRSDKRDLPLTEVRGRQAFDRWLVGRSRWSRARFYPQRLQAEAILYLAIVGGLRRREIYGLSPEAIHPDNEYIIVEGARKGTLRPRPRTVPWITDSMRDACERWIVMRQSIIDTIGGEQDALWLTLNPTGSHELAQPMGVHTFDHLMTGIGYEFHRMRHTAATEMLRSRMPIGSVSKILGHADINMTMRYLEFVPEDLVHEVKIRRSTLERRLGRPMPEENNGHT